MLKIYNTASRKLEEFKPISDTVKIYTCGPTVYSFAHIGNLASYIYWDLLIRTLKMNGFRVKRVLNLTDVGHLTSDGDEGEDKLEKGAKREGKTVYEIADFYIEAFLRDYRVLNLTEPEVLARATDYIEEDKKAVEKMIENGFTYETTDGVYFDTLKFRDYGKFARLDLEGLKAGARVDFNSEKRNVSDFAVWKFILPNENHAMRWGFLGRPGYPGWHLECSTIIDTELGGPIDIHTGGIDHIPIHHTNEIAQTFAMTGRELAKYWLHCDFITIEGEKISKSLGNIYTLKDLDERGFSALDYKMWVLSGSYQGTRNFTFESLEAAKNRRLNWKNKIALCYQGYEPKKNTENFARILEGVNNNLNSASAFFEIDNLELSLDDWKKVDELFGLNLIEEAPNLNEKLAKEIQKRKEAREARDFTTADKIRDELLGQGITLRDTKDGTVWEYNDNFKKSL